MTAEDRRREGHYFAAHRQPAKNARATLPPAQAAEAEETPKASIVEDPSHDHKNAKQVQEEKCRGKLKSFNFEKGYGFITREGADAEVDIFVLRSQLPKSGAVAVGCPVDFVLAYDRGRPQARDVVCLAPEEAPVHDVDLAGRFTGSIKSLGPDYGFISCQQTHEACRRDVYVARAELPGDCAPAQQVSFEVVLNNLGQPQAKNVVACEPAEAEQETELACTNAEDEPVRGYYECCGVEPLGKVSDGEIIAAVDQLAGTRKRW